MTDSLLWSGATPLMRAVSFVGGARRPLDTSPLAAMWNPRTCPIEALADLASAVGVPVWDSAWDETKKRSVIAATIAVKRRRGTVTSFAAVLGMIDAELVQAKSAPQVTVPRASKTPAERAAWAAQFPEVRVYANRTRRVRKGCMVAGGFLAGGHTQASTAAAAAAATAVVVQGGVETPVAVHVDPETGAYTLSLPDRGPRLVAGRPLAGRNRVPQASTAGRRLYAFTMGDAAPDTLAPSVRPIEVNPDGVAQPAVRRGVLTPGKPWGGARRFATLSTAGDRVYRSVRLYVADLVAKGTVGPRGGWILGRSQLGMAPFVVELAVDLSAKKVGRRAFPFRFPGTVRAHDATRVSQAIEAVRGAKLGRDRVLLRTGLSRQITVGDGVTLSGGFRLGQITRSL